MAQLQSTPNTTRTQTGAAERHSSGLDSNSCYYVITMAFNYRSLCDTKRDAILTCDQKPTRVRLIYSREPTTKKWRTERLKK